MENPHELKEQRKQFWIILIIVFLGFIGISMPYLIFPSLFLNETYSFLPLEWSRASKSLFLGLTLAAYPIGQFIGSPILGSLSDEYGRKPLIFYSLIVTAIANLLSAIAISMSLLSLLIVSRFVAGLMEGNIAVARAMCTDLKTISKHESFGKINVSASIAYLAGPLVGGILADKSISSSFTTSTPFFVICGLMLATALLSYFKLKETISLNPQSRPLLEKFNLINRLKNLFSNQKIKTILIISTCLTLSVDIFYEFGPVYLTSKWMLGPSKLALYNSLLCVGLVIGSGALTQFISKRIKSKPPLLIGIGALSILLILIAFINNHILMKVLFGLSGIAIGLATTLVTVILSDSAPDTIQGEVMSVQLSLRVLGDGIICLLGGVLLILSSKIILIISSCLLLLNLIYSFKKCM